MTSDRVGQVLADFAALIDLHSQPQLEAVRTALMLEDVFGVRLTDSDIDPGLLGDAVAIRRLLGGTPSSG